VVQAVRRLTAVDFDPEFIASAKEIMSERWPFTCFLHNVLDKPVEGEFDAVFSLDVLEHIAPQDEDRFLTHMVAPLKSSGVAVIGSPSAQSQAHASEHSRSGHVNCKDQPELQRLMERYFQRVFMFSMNDEVVHTGFHAMAHYNLCLCSGKK
jgi:cyclopropane fatty-acyl-phospholipid synthase-like methyltransferase